MSILSKKMSKKYCQNKEKLNSNIRVLCVFSTLDKGGAESMCMNIYRHIDRNKVQFDFVKHTSKKGAFEDEIISLGGKIYEAPRYYIYNHLPYTNWWKKFLKKHRELHVIHGHFFTISAVYFKVAQKSGLTTIGHSHCTHPKEKSIKNKFADILESRIEKYSDYCFACSQDAGKWIFKNKQFQVLNNAIDARKYRFSKSIREEVRKEFGFVDELVLGTVGRIMNQKNPLGMVEILKNVVDIEPNSKLLWVGDGNMRRDAESLVQKYGLTNNVIFTGVRNDADRLLQAMDVFVFPSFYEGLSVAAIEAQAAGLPCLCSDQVPFETAITNLCQFIPLANYKQWAEKILAVRDIREDTYKQIVDAGYDIHTTSKWVEDFYLQIDKENNRCQH